MVAHVAHCSQDAFRMLVESHQDGLGSDGVRWGGLE